MPFVAFSKERKQNEKNSLIDFQLQGVKLTLHERPSPPGSRSSSRLDTVLRPMSATPTLFHQQEKHRKTPPWLRPQSADHLSSRTHHKRQLATKVDGPGRKNRKSRKNEESLSNLLESCSLDDPIESETSITPSPVPSLTDVLRSTAKLEPGLAAKPPLPRLGACGEATMPTSSKAKTTHKSMDDIINIKFQRWFPESVHNSHYGHDDADADDEREVNGNCGNDLPETSNGNESPVFQQNGIRPNDGENMKNAMQFDAYESSRLDNTLKKLPKSRTMETIVEGDDSSSSFSHSKGNKKHKSQILVEGSDTILVSNMGKSLNKYLRNGEENGELKRNRLVLGPSVNGDSCSDSKTFEQMNGEMKSEDDSNGARHALGVTKGLEDDNAACLMKFINETQNKNGSEGERRQESDKWAVQVNKNIEDKAEGSTYDDILNMIKVLERDEVESLKLESIVAGRSGNSSACSMTAPMGSRDILTFLDEVERSDSRNEFQATPTPQENKPTKVSENILMPPTAGRMGQLMGMDSAELARRVMALTLELEEREAVIQNTNLRLNELQEKLAKQKTDSESTVKRHQKFIDQLLTEKRVLGEQCASVVKEMETKHSKAIQNLEERHGVEMRRVQEKILSAEKQRREKWLEEKTKKIKEQTVKGLEPELERLTRTHQEELAEMRRAHEKELAEVEASCSRRITSAREQGLRDREQAVTEEREAARKKVEHELSEVERSYQDQRRRLLNEVREEKERLERESENLLTVKSRQLEEKWQQAQSDLELRMRALQEKHLAELKNMRETLEGERQSWLNHQTVALTEKEAQIRDLCKKERDRHIDAVVRKLDQEAQEKEKTVESKILKLKEQYESDVKEAESVQAELRRKLKDCREECQQHEENENALRSQISQLQSHQHILNEQLKRSERENSERGMVVRHEASSQIAMLQRELADERLKKEELVTALHAEKEKELQQLYNRVKEAISKKEEAVRLVQKQRDAALEQCCQLEAMLEHQRKELIQRKCS